MYRLIMKTTFGIVADLGRHESKELSRDDLVSVDVVLRHKGLAPVLPGSWAELWHVLTNHSA